MASAILIPILKMFIVVLIMLARIFVPTSRVGVVIWLVLWVIIFKSWSSEKKAVRIAAKAILITQGSLFLIGIVAALILGGKK